MQFTHSLTHSREDQELFQKDLAALEGWDSAWVMRFNAAKCNIMRISHSTKLLTCLYSLYNHFLQEVNQAKYLGVNITKELQWSGHITSTTDKANSFLGFLRPGMCSERDSPLEPFVLLAPGQPELARLICGAHLGPPVLTRKQKRPRVNSLVCDRVAAFSVAGPPEVLSRMSRPVTQAAERERELARACSQRLKQVGWFRCLPPFLRLTKQAGTPGFHPSRSWRVAFH